MKIEKITFRNFGSYGNKTLDLQMPEDPGFFLIQGKNGNGKCLSPKTKIQVLTDSSEIEKFQEFLRLYRSKE
jgi:hypothetical protein